RAPAKAVAMGDLDDLDARPVQRVRGGAHLLLGELVGHRVAAVAQGGVGDADVVADLRHVSSSTRPSLGIRRRAGVAARIRLSHAELPAFAAAISSPTRAAAAVMMSR